MNTRIITTAILSLISGLTIGFLIANRLNRSTTERLQSEISQLKTAQADDRTSGATLSDDELKARIRRADENPADLNYQRNFGTALYRYASMKKDVQMLNESARLLTRVLAADPSSFDVNVTLGNAYFDIGYFSQDSASYLKAREFYNTALKQRPNDAALRTDFALTYFLPDSADYARANQEFEQALKIDPRNEKALEFGVQSFLKTNDRANARKLLDSLKSVNATNSSISALESAILDQENSTN